MRGEEGGALLEFAAVFPLLVFVLYALIAMGMALSAKNSITHAAAEGARAAVGASDAATAQSQATAAVARSLSWMGSKYQPGTDLTVTTATCTGGTAMCITVKIVYPYSSRPLVPNAPLVSMVTPSTMTATAVVEYS